MRTIEKIIEVDRPVSAVYGQWARSQDFPQFMQGIREVQMLDDKQLGWKAKIGGKALEWDAEILEQVPDRRISWSSISGARNSGTVTFVSLTPAKTRVILYLSYDPKGILENLGANLGIVSTRVKGDLDRFKKFVESRVAPAKLVDVAEVVIPARPLNGSRETSITQWRS